MQITAERLKLLFTETEIPKKKLATFLGISSQRLSNWLNRGSIPAEYIPKIAEFFNVTTDYLLGTDDNKGIYAPAISNNAPAIAGVNNRIHLTPPAPKQPVSTKIAFITEMLQTFSDDKLDEIIKCLYKNCIE